MIPISFPGSVEIGKPANMTDEQCGSAWAIIHKDDKGQTTGFTTCWKPSYEDMQAINRGEGIYVSFPYSALPAMSMFTLDEKGEINQ